MILFENMLGGKVIPIEQVRENFSKKGIVKDNKTTINLWDVMIDFDFVRD